MRHIMYHNKGRYILRKAHPPGLNKHIYSNLQNFTYFTSKLAVGGVASERIIAPAVLDTEQGDFHPDTAAFFDCKAKWRISMDADHNI